MEASQKVVPSMIEQATSIYVKPIANIRSELKQFSAIFYLQNTAYNDLILKPSTYKHPKVFNLIPHFQYSGYVSIYLKLEFS